MSIEQEIELDDEIEQEEEVEQEEIEQEESEEEELVVSIGDEEPEEEEPQATAPWVKELRQKNREDVKRIKELEARLEEITKPKAVELGKKPKLEDFDYDGDKYESELELWYERKREADIKAAEADEVRRSQEQEWTSRLTAHEEAKKELKVDDYEDAESFVQESFDITQQGIIVQGADNSALVVYALGKNPKKAKELAAIKDPVKFAFEVARLETKLKVSGKKRPPAPEKAVVGSGKSSGAVDSTLNRLREEAAKTGDFSKVMEYKRKKRA